MNRVMLNVRVLSLVAAVTVAVVAAGSLGPPRQAEANAADPTGVICGYLHDLVISPPIASFSGTTLARIESDGGGGFVLTAVAYTNPTSTAMPDCKTPQDVNFPGGTIAPDAANEVRPSLTGLKFNAPVLSGSGCQEDFTFAGATFADWTNISVTLTINKAPTQSTGSFSFETGYADEAACLAGGNPTTVSVDFDALYQDGPDEAVADFDSDWDKDGCLDWNELNPSQQAQHLDPFAPDCGVGGVAELPGVATAPLDAAASSGSNAGLIAALVAVAAAATAALGAGALYARRRLTR